MASLSEAWISWQVSHSCQIYLCTACGLDANAFLVYSFVVIILHVFQEAVTLQREHAVVACIAGYLSQQSLIT